MFYRKESVAIMNETLSKVECRLNILNTRLEICEGLVKSCKNLIAEEHRKKWWLEHPEVAYFTARTSWETNYGHSEWESELSFYVESVIGLDGLEIYDICFSGFPTLEEDILDDERFTTYRNPFLCT